jgi:hypothetical protein
MKQATRRLYAAGHWMPKSYDRYIEAKRAIDAWAYAPKARWPLFAEVYGPTPLGGVWEGK